MFRRKTKNQTERQRAQQTGSSPVFSYYSSRRSDEDVNARNKARPAPKGSFLKYTPSIIAAVLIIGSLLYCSFINTRPRIVSTAPPGPTQQLDTTKYQNGIQDILDDSIFNRSKLTFRSARLQEQIQRQYPELGDVAVTVPLLSRRPIVTISPSPATLILANQQTALVVDSKGRAIADARQLVDKSAVITVTDESGLTLEQGKAVIPVSYVDFITTIKYQLDAKSIIIDSVTLPRVPNELYVRLKDKPYYIKFNLQADARQQTGVLLALFKELEEENITPAEYIDVRVDERVFYK